MRRRALPPVWRRLGADNRGVAAVEFALVAPAIILLYLVGFDVCEAATVYRKVTDTTAQIASVTSQYTQMTSGNVSLVESASAQIMAPYSTGPLSIVLSEVSTDANGTPTVTWSQAYQGTPLAVGASVTMPANYNAANSSYILVQTTYTYTPVIAGNFIGPIQMASQLVMLPRNSTSITYLG